MEQLIILILFLLLPGLIRKLTGQQKKGGAPRKARPAASSAPQGEPEQVERELPEWLQNLAETLADTKEQVEEAIPDISLFEEEEPEPAIESIPVTPGPEWGRTASAPTTMPSPPTRERAFVPLTVPPRHQLHSRRRQREYLPKSRHDWRRAVILAEVLGNPRGLSPWREPEIEGGQG